MHVDDGINAFSTDGSGTKINWWKTVYILALYK